MKQPVPLPSVERLKELFDYHPDGYLTWKIKASRNTVIGSRAGTTSLRYEQIRIDKKLYSVHRVIWKWHTGEDPNNLIDHINQDKKDNRIENLRQCSKAQNIRNQSFKGYRLSGKKFQARIKVQGKEIHLGTFNTEAEASSAYQSAHTLYFGTFSPYQTC